MAFNVLEALQQLGQNSMQTPRAPSMPSGAETIFAPPQNMPAAFAAQAGKLDPNILQQLGGLNQGPIETPRIDVGPVQTPDLSQAPQSAPSRAPRERRSILDIIGGISDTVATVGGAPAQYQPRLDAQAARQMAAEDRGFMLEDRGFAQEDRELAKEDRNLNRQVIEQNLGSGEIEQNAARVEMLSNAANGLRNVFGRYGVEGVARAWPMLAQEIGVPVEKIQQIGAQLQANPDETIRALEQAAASGSSGDFGLQPFYARDAQGNVSAYQMNKNGGIVPINLPEGQVPAPPTRTVDTGDNMVITDTRGGGPIRIMPVSGGPERGERPIVDANGNITGYTPVTGSDLEYERSEPERERQRSYEKYENGLTAASPVLDRIDNAIDDLAEAGSVYSESQGIGGRIGTFADQNLPFVRQIFNEQGTSAAERLEAARTQFVMNVQPMLMEIEGSGVLAGSRMMDTPKEVERLMSVVANATDETSAREAASAMRQRLTGLMEFVRQKRAQQRRQPGRQGAEQTAPSVSNW